LACELLDFADGTDAIEAGIQQGGCMQTQEFLDQVQDKAHLATIGEALLATRATLETLAERLGPDDAQHLATRLPPEIQLLLLEGSTLLPERFSSNEFLLRVCAREGIDLTESTHHARAVIDVLTQAVPTNDASDVLDRLPDDYRRLLPDYFCASTTSSR
jgi:uncharacterized protein (DUF2267 family)